MGKKEGAREDRRRIGRWDEGRVRDRKTGETMRGNGEEEKK